MDRVAVVGEPVAALVAARQIQLAVGADDDAAAAVVVMRRQVVDHRHRRSERLGGRVVGVAAHAQPAGDAAAGVGVVGGDQEHPVTAARLQEVGVQGHAHQAVLHRGLIDVVERERDAARAVGRVHAGDAEGGPLGDPQVAVRPPRHLPGIAEIGGDDAAGERLAPWRRRAARILTRADRGRGGHDQQEHGPRLSTLCHSNPP